MMNELEALLAGIVSEPHEETRWLVLADWLEENDDPRRGELLRLHRKMLATLLRAGSLRGAGVVAGPRRGVDCGGTTFRMPQDSGKGFPLRCHICVQIPDDRRTVLVADSEVRTIRTESDATHITTADRLKLFGRCFARLRITD